MNLALSSEGTVASDIVVDLEAAQTDEGYSHTFNNLKHNTKYDIKFNNVSSNGNVVVLDNELNFMTSKTELKMLAPIVTTDYINPSLNVTINALTDPDQSAKKIIFSAYSANDLVNPIQVITKDYHPTNKTHSFVIDNNTIQRDTLYRFTVSIIADDNNNLIEIESLPTGIFSIEGKRPPTANIQIALVTPSASGSATVTDLESTIQSGIASVVLKNNQNVIVETIPIPADGTEYTFTFLTPLNANEAYTVEAQATFNLDNGKPGYSNYPLTVKNIRGALFSFSNIFFQSK